MKKKCQVVMLPTEKATNFPFIGVYHDNGRKLITYVNSNSTNSALTQPQHLYITSDEEIKEGDWCYVKWGTNISRKDLYEVSKCTKIGKGNIHYFDSMSMCFGKHELNAKKIIATTDESLKIDVGMRAVLTGRPELVNMPRPSNEFLKKYCDLGGIDEVMVEYGEAQIADFEDENYPIYKTILKVAPDNTITIKPVQKEN